MQLRTASPMILLVLLGTGTNGRPADNDGKYNPRKYNRNSKYKHANDGDYLDDVSRYRYVHYDDGDRGRYFHIHIPYDGGFGNYEGGHEPYHSPPYDPTGAYAEYIDKYQSLSHPFDANSYDIKKPSIYLEYGVPYPSSSYGTPSSEPHTAADDLDVRKSLLPGPGTGYLPIPKPEDAELRLSASEKKPQFTPYPEININDITFTTATPTTVDQLNDVTTTEKSADTRSATTASDAPTTTEANDITTEISTQQQHHRHHHDQPCIITDRGEPKETQSA